ncbi:hypothetical protein Hanom_Chr07g00605651 [Helianthus anomalus]
MKSFTSVALLEDLSGDALLTTSQPSNLVLVQAPKTHTQKSSRNKMNKTFYLQTFFI